MKTRFYVTVQLSNGGIESLDIELDLEHDRANYDTFKAYVDEYDEKYMSYDQLGLWSKGHIISWSKYE